MNAENSEVDPFRKMRLILELRRAGFTDNRLLNAFERLSREDFLPTEFAEYAYDDVALPIACGQNASRPAALAEMLTALELAETRTQVVLEIGTGSGYLTALLAHQCKRVYSVERYRTLIEAARKRFEKLAISNIVTLCADGQLGWENSGPFDRIISTCAVEEVPPAWLEQLKPDGILIVPIGTNEEQKIVRIRNSGSKNFPSEALGPSNFLHLIEGAAKEL